MRKVAAMLDTKGYPEHCAGWEAATWDDGDHVHVLPLADTVQHSEDPDADCICGATTEPCERPDGSMGWLITHHSLDGRERWES